ncbi:mitochondrial import inner membrane translocase subunit Tim54 [Parasitella parasitica]|nr:mitochondrial import inner membrane translocase subunit Tim54 [Parasitella parasitica]
MPLPFGLKAPSKGTLIFSSVAGAISGIIYTSNKNAEDARVRLVQRVSFLADRPCDVHEMPRKVLVYISAPPGDGLEKSRNWFREYVKPILVAGAVDYEIKEARSAGQIENSVIEEVVKRRREAEEASKSAEENQEQVDNVELIGHSNNPFASPKMKEMMKIKAGNTADYDGILAIGRNAYREVLSGLSKGCDASLAVVAEEQKTPDETTSQFDNSTEEQEEKQQTEVDPVEPVESENFGTDSQHQGEEKYFSLPSRFSPVMYIPHVNIIGWSNIPYRLWMWYFDNRRIEDVGKYVVAAVLNNTRPIEERDANLGQQEKKYWIGDEKVEELKKNDGVIVIDPRIVDKLSTFTSEDLP